MKKLLLALTAAASASAFAQTQTSGFDGFVSAGIGTNNLSANGISGSSAMSNLRATFSFTHPTGFGIQVDNVIENQNIGADTWGITNNTDPKFGNRDLAVHGFYRKDNFLVGVIYQARTVNLKGDDLAVTLPIDRTFMGVEGQYDLGGVTLTGATAQDKVSAGAEGVTGHTHAVGARYFLSDNLRADVAYKTSKFSFMDQSSTTNSMSLGGEYKFDKSPFSAFAKYEYMNGSFLDTKRLLVGISWNFGKESLKARNSSGASLNPIGGDNQLLGFLGAVAR